MRNISRDLKHFLAKEKGTQAGATIAVALGRFWATLNTCQSKPPCVMPHVALCPWPLTAVPLRCGDAGVIMSAWNRAVTALKIYRLHGRPGTVFKWWQWCRRGNGQRGKDRQRGRGNRRRESGQRGGGHGRDRQEGEATAKQVH